MASAVAGIADALQSGNFSAVVDSVAAIANLPDSAARVLKYVVQADLLNAAKALIPLASQALSPYINRTLTSISDGSITLSSGERAALASAVSAVGSALLSGNFSAAIQALVAVSGMPSSAATAIDQIAQGNLDGGIDAVLDVVVDGTSALFQQQITSIPGITLSSGEQAALTAAASEVAAWFMNLHQLDASQSSPQMKDRGSTSNK